MILTDQELNLLLQISYSISATSDAMLSEEYDNTTPEYARGYIKAFSRYSEDDRVLFVYFLMKHVFTKLD